MRFMSRAAGRVVSSVTFAPVCQHTCCLPLHCYLNVSADCGISHEQPQVQLYTAARIIKMHQHTQPFHIASCCIRVEADGLTAASANPCWPVFQVSKVVHIQAGCHTCKHHMHIQMCCTAQVHSTAQRVLHSTSVLHSTESSQVNGTALAPLALLAATHADSNR